MEYPACYAVLGRPEGDSEQGPCSHRIIICMRAHTHIYDCKGSPRICPQPDPQITRHGLVLAHTPDSPRTYTQLFTCVWLRSHAAQTNLHFPIKLLDCSSGGVPSETKDSPVSSGADLNHQFWYSNEPEVPAVLSSQCCS